MGEAPGETFWKVVLDGLMETVLEIVCLGNNLKDKTMDVSLIIEHILEMRC